MDKNTGFSFSFVIFSQSPEGNGQNGQKHGVFIQILFLTRRTDNDWLDCTSEINNLWGGLVCFKKKLKGTCFTKS